LAKLALQDTNLLLLDEPTNHLDIPSQEVLEAVLDEYEGTILLVTHDRYLIDALGTQIWEIDPDESQLSVFEGTYSQRREERERLAALRMAEFSQITNPRSIRRSADPAVKEERRRVARLQELENKIAALEIQIADLGRKLERPPKDTALVRKWGNQYASLQAEMDSWLAEWEGLQH
jgi:ATP-binding cassette subfamily F protein 3